MDDYMFQFIYETLENYKRALRAESCQIIKKNMDQFSWNQKPLSVDRFGRGGLL